MFFKLEELNTFFCILEVILENTSQWLYEPVHLQRTPGIQQFKMQSFISSLTKNYFITITVQKISSFNSSNHFWDTTDFRVPYPKRQSPLLIMSTKKLLFPTKKLAFSGMQKTQFILHIRSWDTANFKVSRKHTTFDYAHQNIFKSTFNFHDFVWTCKKSDYFVMLF